MDAALLTAAVILAWALTSMAVDATFRTWSLGRADRDRRRVHERAVIERIRLEARARRHSMTKSDGD